MKKDIKLLIESVFGDVDVLGPDEEYDMTGLVVDYVDLGLPSGTKWCKYNVGAKTETDYGDYYQWGETEGNVIELYYDGSCYNYAKYNKEDGLTLLLPEDDIAYQTSNGLYRMPTKEQYEELINNTDHEWFENYKDSGVNGFVFSSKVNNNYIFIPASGLQYDNSIDKQGKSKSFKSRNLYGHFWSSSINTEDSNRAWIMCLRRSDFYSSNYSFKRNDGFSVRGVLNKK